MENIELAVKEFDPALLSNLNFRHPDSFKFNILTSGLEEITRGPLILTVVEAFINCCNTDEQSLDRLPLTSLF